MDVQKSGIKKVVIYLEHLGMSTEAIQAYLYLIEHGPHTVLGISRGLKTGRTKLYPLLEDLADKQLINVHERHYGTSYEARPPEVLEFLVSERESQSDSLRKGLSGVVDSLKEVFQASPVSSRVSEYRGIDGLKQMNWNLAKAEKEFRVLELAGLDKHLGKHFADKIRGICNEKQIRSYDLTNNLNRRQETGVDLTLNSVRYIDPLVFRIEFETFIYNNCVALLSYNSEDIFGVEIYNDKLARQQKQLFDLLWSQSKPI